MKIEVDDNITISAVIISIVVAASCVSGYGCHKMETTRQDAIKAGLVEKQNPGSYTKLWAKP